MIPSWRSLPIRSRSSTTASRWTWSWSRAFSMAIPAWTREHLDEPLVVLGELGRADLVGEVEVADRRALDRHGHAEERAHRRMVGREAELSRVRGDVADAERPALADDQAEQAVTRRQRPDRARGPRARSRS